MLGATVAFSVRFSILRARRYAARRTYATHRNGRSLMSTSREPVNARLLFALTLLLSGAFGHSVSAVATVASVTLNPATVAGGSGGTSTATVTLSESAPAGGSILTISSSVTPLAASVPSITVPAGASTATLTVATHAL